MALNRDKVEAAALKLLQQGKHDKAIVEFKRLVEENPSDERTWLRLGETYSKIGARKECVEAYEHVAGIYTERGFFLKAVAAYKQALRVDAGFSGLHLRLAELYQQLGLASDAITHYQQAAVLLEQQGKPRESLDILKRMVDLDPDNIPSRIKLGELFAQQGLREEAVEELRGALAFLKEQGRVDDFARVGEKLVAYDVGAVDVALDLARMYMNSNQPNLALQKLQMCFNHDSRNVEVLSMIGEAFLRLDKPGKSLSVFKELAKIYAADGNIEHANAQWQRVLEIAPDDAEATAALQQSAGPATQSVASLGDVATQAGAGYGAGGWPAAAYPSGQAPPRAASAANIAAAGLAPVRNSEDDVLAKLLTETDVYVKYGLRDKAREHLDRIFAMRADYVPAFEKLHRLQQQTSDPGLADTLRRLLELDPQHARASEWRDELTALEAANVSIPAGFPISGFSAPQAPPRAATAGLPGGGLPGGGLPGGGLPGGGLPGGALPGGGLPGRTATGLSTPTSRGSGAGWPAPMPAAAPMGDNEVILMDESHEGDEEIIEDPSDLVKLEDSGASVEDEPLLPAAAVGDQAYAAAAKAPALPPDESLGDTFWGTPSTQKILSSDGPPPLALGVVEGSIDAGGDGAVLDLETEAMVRDALASYDSGVMSRVTGELIEPAPAVLGRLEPDNDGADEAQFADQTGLLTLASEELEEVQEIEPLPSGTGAAVTEPVGGDAFAAAHDAFSAASAEAAFDDAFNAPSSSAARVPATPSILEMEPMLSPGSDYLGEGGDDDEFSDRTVAMPVRPGSVPRSVSGATPREEQPDIDDPFAPPPRVELSRAEVAPQQSSGFEEEDARTIFSPMEELAPPPPAFTPAPPRAPTPPPAPLPEPPPRSPSMAMQAAFAEPSQVSSYGGKLGTASKAQGFENDPANQFFPEELEEAEFFIQQELLDEAKEILTAILDDVPDSDRVQWMLARISAKEAGEPEPPAPWEQNLLEGLQAELETLGLGAAQAAPDAVDDQQVSMEEVLSQFKKGVAETVPDDDAATHYDLGIAYREMGLHDEAVGAFELAARSPAKAADALYLVGLTRFDLGQYTESLQALDKAVAQPSATPAQRAASEYQRGLCLEQLGRSPEALRAFKAAQTHGSSAPDLERRIQALSSGKGGGMNGHVT